MKISTKGRYSIRVLLDLAEHRDDGYIPLKTVADRQGISKKYLDQIMLILNRTSYLKTTRGAQGGYMLAMPPSAYSIGGILRLTEGSIAPPPALTPVKRAASAPTNAWPATSGRDWRM